VRNCLEVCRRVFVWLRFCVAVLATLLRHTRKGSWLKDDVPTLKHLFQRECIEFYEALFTDENVKGEAVDVAITAMALAEKKGAL
jgi:hypothetical protein